MTKLVDRASGRRDPTMRHRALDGTYVRRSTHARPRSAFLRARDDFFTRELLGALDDGLKLLEPAPSWTKQQSKEAVQRVVARLPSPRIKELATEFGARFFSHAENAPRWRTTGGDGAVKARLYDARLTVRLGMLILDLRAETGKAPRAVELWPEIMRRTDELYLAAEGPAAADELAGLGGAFSSGAGSSTSIFKSVLEGLCATAEAEAK